jgi:SAM-dependent methyltransferase
MTRPKNKKGRHDRIMIPSNIDEESLLLREGPPSSALAEQLVNFANEAFIFADVSQSRRKTDGETEAQHPSAPPQSFFADVVAPPLTEFHLKNTKVVQSREQILTLLPKGGVCVAVETGTGSFAREILSALEPARLDLCDPDFNAFDDSPFAAGINQGIVTMHEGDGAEHLAAQPDCHFDLIHLQTDHSYVGAARALEQAGRKLKDEGYIICTNYTTYSPLDGAKCGVARAVNEFCHRNGFEVICLALNSLGYHDVALRKQAGFVGAGWNGAVLDAPDPATFLPDVWEHLIHQYQIRSVLDVGAGVGWSTKWFTDRGIYTLGIEGWHEAIERSLCKANIIEHDYTSAPFIPSMVLDLAWCAGFVEQIDEEFIPNFMASFRSCQYVCLTHAEPGEESVHHVNCRPTEYWIRKMDEFGFDYDPVETAYLRSTDKHKAPRGRRTLTFFKRRG